MLPRWLIGTESACNAEDVGLIHGSGKSPGEGNGNPLQYSCLGNPMDRGAWRATVHGVTKSWTRPSTRMSIPLCRDHIWFTHPSVDSWALLHFRFSSVQFSSVAQSCPTLQPHEPQDTRPPCPSPTPRVHPNPCSLSR